ncbi:MAG: hypothetical protein CO117_04300 [Flavobacteriaceae bacterium CG_4_9_14_3_um_filter_33_16]|nr:MAG: hypothetical protein CO117_04300 [Flavobacteriaceae bacterium CG_4_9_14_3_um_filter_33_16]
MSDYYEEVSNAIKQQPYSSLLDDYINGLSEYLRNRSIEITNIEFVDEKDKNKLPTIDKLNPFASILIHTKIRNKLTSTQIMSNRLLYYTKTKDLSAAIVRQFLGDLALHYGIVLRVHILCGKYAGSIGELIGKKILLGKHQITNKVIEIPIMSKRSFELVDPTTNLQLVIVPSTNTIRDMFGNKIHPGDVIAFSDSNIRYGLYVDYDVITKKHVVDIVYDDTIFRRVLPLAKNVINLSSNPEKDLKDEIMLIKLKKTD